MHGLPFFASASALRRPPPSLFPSLSLLISRQFSPSSTAHAKKRNMPPKKVVQEKKTLLGRPGNNLKIGIVGLFPLASPTYQPSNLLSTGLPNVGKSSFFNTLSKTGQEHTSHSALPFVETTHRRPWQGRQLSICHDQPRRSAYSCAR